MGVIYGAKYLRINYEKFFKGCLPQILLGTFWNPLSHIQDLKKQYLLN